MILLGGAIVRLSVICIEALVGCVLLAAVVVLAVAEVMELLKGVVTPAKLLKVVSIDY